MATKSAYTVFIVDDDTKMLTMLKSYLDQNSVYNLDIHTFATGEDCLEKLEMDPEVVILDYYFDSINEKAQNGLEILKTIKEKKPRAEVIMLSAQDSLEEAMNMIHTGANDYIIKNDSAMLRSQRVTDKILKTFEREQRLKDYKRNMKITIAIFIVFLIALITFVVIATSTE